MKSPLPSPAIVLTALASFLIPAASAGVRHTGGMKVGPRDGIFAENTNSTNGWGTFKQLIDHSNPDFGTFSQRYWYGTEFWNGTGSPIILVCPGEQAADHFNTTYTTLQRLPGRFAKEVGGAVVILEHRYWGDSSPFEQLTVENLKFLTLKNSIHDLTYFANNFEAPFDRNNTSPRDVPWVFSGGSYPGALAGWTAAVDPGTFWAYHGTSGVVEAIGDFWQYFAPVQEATPQNCSKDLSLVIDYVDDVLLQGDAAQKKALKDAFMLHDLEDADFAA